MAALEGQRQDGCHGEPGQDATTVRIYSVGVLNSIHGKPTFLNHRRSALIDCAAVAVAQNTARPDTTLVALPSKSATVFPAGGALRNRVWVTPLNVA